MAVCGRCWICGGKFDCTPRPCEDCAEFGRGPTKVESWELPHPSSGSQYQHKICFECVELVENGFFASALETFELFAKKRN